MTPNVSFQDLFSIKGKIALVDRGGCTFVQKVQIAQMNGALAVTSYPSIAPDGTFVAFASAATNLITNDTNGVADVFCLPSP